MKTSAIIEGLQILSKYYEPHDGYHNGAEHDVLYAYPTTRRVDRPDVEQLVKLGWIQERPAPIPPRPFDVG
jgi:hypothetical protein